MVFERIFALLFSSIPLTIYAFLCVVVFCALYQIFVLRKVAKREGVKLGRGHFGLVYLLLFYLLLVYLVTGMGTVWDIGRYETLIRMSEVHLVPFGTFADITPYLLNVLMTVPLGFLLAFIWKEFRCWWRVALAGFGLSVLIEMSQLLNRRGTTTDDLIMNTLGAVLGYFLCLAVVKGLMRKKFVRKDRAKSPVIRHEAVVYVVGSFMGMFLLFGAVSLEGIHFGVEGRGDVVMVEADHIMGVVLGVGEREIRVEKVETSVLADGSMIAVDADVELVFDIGEGVVVELRRTNAAGDLGVVETSVISLGDVRVGDTVHVFGEEDGDGFMVERVEVWRFDL
ncbi:VanZ family protein [Candidatus Saccharibacteria bacterium]|nr:VanZ family protein [Candidatus Saccharibacteria bacterium]